MPSRRKILQGAAGAAAVFPVLGEPHQHGGASGGSAAAYKPKWATAAEMKLMAELADIIIPRTETPGASDAKVQEFIDYTLSSDAKRRDEVRAGLQWFAGLAAAGRVDALRKADRSPRTKEGRFFRLFKDLTIDGYYASREGLVTELGWSGNTYLPEFKGCTHPEHKG
ncbi:MAG: gluconate 2-dehydrogenase subunit 3 family protein [Bryobacterales bacterium]|nr:gluconate 2-dehydrogenase subunit 3 family protein [Bryobacterales bacterium]